MNEHEFFNFAMFSVGLSSFSVGFCLATTLFTTVQNWNNLMVGLKWLFGKRNRA